MDVFNHILVHRGNIDETEVASTEVAIDREASSSIVESDDAESTPVIIESNGIANAEPVDIQEVDPEVSVTETLEEVVIIPVQRESTFNPYMTDDVILEPVTNNITEPAALPTIVSAEPVIATTELADLEVLVVNESEVPVTSTEPAEQVEPSISTTIEPAVLSAVVVTEPEIATTEPADLVEPIINVSEVLVASNEPAVRE